MRGARRRRVQGAGAFCGDRGQVYGREGRECGHGDGRTWVVGHLATALVVVVGLRLRRWGRWKELANGGVHKGGVRGGGGRVSGQAAGGAMWAVGEGGGTGARGWVWGHSG